MLAFNGLDAGFCQYLFLHLEVFDLANLRLAAVRAEGDSGNANR
jgi:hypothetical protein